MLSLMTFEIGNNYYAIETQNLVEIVQAVQITLIPGSRDEVCGVINYRGYLIPVIGGDRLLNQKFRLTLVQQHMLILSSGAELAVPALCLLVDQVLKFSVPKEIQNISDLITGYQENELFEYIVKVETNLVPVLNIITLIKRFASNIIDNILAEKNDA